MKLALSILALALLAFIGGSVLYWKIYNSGLDVGYERGAMYEARYEQCFGKAPSAWARLQERRYVNDPFEMPCEWVGMFEHKS